ncbi:MAG: Do family serine endopeptidase [Bacteroidia bacterium]
MRNSFLTSFVAAVMGSALTFGAIWLTQSKDQQTLQVQYQNTTPVVGAVYTLDESGDAVPLDFTAVAERVTPAVVHITSSSMRDNTPTASNPFEEFFGPNSQFESPNRQRQQRPQVGTGSGVIIAQDGYIVTNNHVIDKADDIEVVLSDNRSYKATVIGTDPSTDLALLKIEEKGLAYIPFVDSDKVKVGEWVMAVGNPFNLNSTVTAGIVSAKGRNINILREQSAIESFIQTDAAINPGNSGGALVNLNGGLIGINTAIASPTGAYAGYGFAVPAKLVSKVIEDLMTYGIVQRGYIGVMIRPVDGSLVSEKGLSVNQGIYVDSVLATGAAASAGIEEGDVILEVDGITVNTPSELQEKVGRRRPGDEVNVKLNRFGDEKSFDMVLNNRDGNTNVVKKISNSLLQSLGASFREVGKTTAAKLDIEGGAQLESLSRGKLSQYTDIREGFIITHLDGERVDDVDDLLDQLEDKKGNVMLEGIYPNGMKRYYAFGM